ncbi:MAG: hypothetical protein HKN15_08115 [Xanthomonadales bacterium]|nr:hypothetical protein [Xanthomonadales bacterium]
MKFNIKLILLGGLAYYVAQWVIAMVTGMVIHEGILDPVYMAVPEFWRPELNQDPPDMAALMPLWIVTGLIGAFIGVFIYDNIRAALAGSPAISGAKFGFLAGLFYASICMGFNGVFNVPETIWMWWAIEGFVIFIPSGAVLGWVTPKIAKD